MLQSVCSVQPLSYRSKPGLPCMSISKARSLPLVKYNSAAPPSLVWAEKNAADFFQNLRRRHMRKGMLPYGNIPFVAWLFGFELTCLPSVLEKTLILLDFSMFSYVRGAYGDRLFCIAVCFCTRYRSGFLFIAVA